MCVCAWCCMSALPWVSVSRHKAVFGSERVGIKGGSCRTSLLFWCIVSPLTSRPCSQQGMGVETQWNLQDHCSQLQVPHNSGPTWVHAHKSLMLSISPLHFELMLGLLCMQWLITLPACQWLVWWNAVTLLLHVLLQCRTIIRENAKLSFMLRKHL